MQRRTFLALLACLPLAARANTSLADLQAEATRRTKIFQEQLTQLATSQPKAIYFNAGDPVIGAANAMRSILVFTDFNCPYCRKIDAILQQVAQDGSARFVLKWQTMMADSSAEAASFALNVWQAAHPKYSQVHTALLKAPMPITSQAIRAIAQQTQTEHLLKLAEPPALASSVQLGQQLRIFATPSMLIGNRVMSGMTDEGTLKKAIAEWRMG